jgi:hypothetical protein
LGVQLDGGDVPEHVHDEAREPVGLSVDQAVARRLLAREPELLAELNGLLNTLHEEVGAERNVQTTAHAYRERLRLRVEAAPEEFSLRILHGDLGAGVWAADDLGHGLAIDPGVPGVDGLNVAGLENNVRHGECER